MIKLIDKAVLYKYGKVYVEQGVIAGCAGGMFENICEASNILGDTPVNNNDFTLDVYPSSQPVYKALVDSFDNKIYRARVYNAYKNGDKNKELVYGPNIADWPKMENLKDNLLLRVVSVLQDPVTTTDELIPSGETSSYRSNPLKLAEFALSRKDPMYVGRAKAVKEEGFPTGTKFNKENTTYGSVVCSIKPGDGSAREQAASCQRVLGGVANIAKEYATKRYRSNLIN
ncbi:MAG: hypothetical protein KBS91_00785, partial [Firmicutes bacterium]|nr:hypothetical protein [Candidatus Caballimonas caccae]